MKAEVGAAAGDLGLPYLAVRLQMPGNSFNLQSGPKVHKARAHCH